MVIGDFLEMVIVLVMGVSGIIVNDKMGFVEVGVGFELGVVNDVSFGVNLVRERLEVDGRSGNFFFGGVVIVGEVIIVGKIEIYYLVLGVDESSESGKVSVYMLVVEEINM